MKKVVALDEWRMQAEAQAEADAEALVERLDDGFLRLDQLAELRLAERGLESTDVEHVIRRGKLRVQEVREDGIVRCYVQGVAVDKASLRIEVWIGEDFIIVANVN